MSKVVLDRANVDYTTVDIEDVPETKDQPISEGYRTMPVVKVFDTELLAAVDSWSGFHPEKLRAWGNKIESEGVE